MLVEEYVGRELKFFVGRNNRGMQTTKITRLFIIQTVRDGSVKLKIKDYAL